MLWWEINKWVWELRKRSVKLCGGSKCELLLWSVFSHVLGHIGWYICSLGSEPGGWSSSFKTSGLKGGALCTYSPGRAADAFIFWDVGRTWVLGTSWCLFLWPPPLEQSLMVEIMTRDTALEKLTFSLVCLQSFPQSPALWSPLPQPESSTTHLRSHHLQEKDEVSWHGSQGLSWTGACPSRQPSFLTLLPSSVPRALALWNYLWFLELNLLVGLRVDF